MRVLILVVVLLAVCHARLKTKPPGFDALAAAEEMKSNSCNEVALFAYNYLTTGKGALGKFSIGAAWKEADIEQFITPNRVFMLGAGIGDEVSKAGVVNHWFLFQTYNTKEGVAAVIYQGFKDGALAAENQEKEGYFYSGRQWTEALKAWFSGTEAPKSDAFLPPIVNEVPNLAGGLAGMINSITLWSDSGRDEPERIAETYNKLFSPAKDKFERKDALLSLKTFTDDKKSERGNLQVFLVHVNGADGAQLSGDVHASVLGEQKFEEVEDSSRSDRKLGMAPSTVKLAKARAHMHLKVARTGATA